MANLFIKKVSAIQLLELLLVQSSEEYIFLLQEIKLDLPSIPHIFISSVAQQGILALKDMLWKEINAM